MRGRKPKPTPLKILEGTRKDRVNGSEPAAVAGRPAPPDYLDDVALAEWERILPQIEALGILSLTDGAALAIYCQAHSQAIAADEEVKQHGMLIETGAGGWKANPAVAIGRTARAAATRLLTEFGLTPSSRSRMSAPGAGAKDELDEFLSEQA